jgi:two-component system response regulator VicR
MKKIKILYVEDEPFLGKIVNESLQSRGFEVRMIKDGKDVMDAYKAFQPQICVLDVMLPNVDGFTLGEEIKKLTPDQPIIYLTAKNQTEDLVKGFQSGGNDYIKKPFSMEELIIRIKNLLQLTQNQSFDAAEKKHYQMGQYIFDPNKYELAIGEKARNLSHREAELLKIFAENPNQAVERKHILKKIWGDDSFFNSRNLDVYITKLRGYLKEDSKVQIITLKGVGYRFVVEG